MLSTPYLPPSLGYGAAGSPLALRKGEAERIAAVLALVGIRRLIVLSIVSHSALKNE
jgi:hypothetical protein